MIAWQQQEAGTIYSTIYTHERREFDAFGRLIEERRRLAKDGGGFSESKRIHAWEPSGLRRRESTWQNADSFDRDFATYFRNYDAFGRPREVERPDGETQTLTYQGERLITSTVRLRTAIDGFSNVTTTTEKDALGRTIATITPVHTTEFRFDPYDQIYRASRQDSSQNSPVTQIRLYGQDARGFLLSERQMVVPGVSRWRF